MNEITRLYFVSAQQLGLAPIPEPYIHGFKIIIDGVMYFFRNGQTPLNEAVPVEVSINKLSVNLLWAQAGIPTTKATAYTGQDFLDNPSLDNLELKFPVVVKPTYNSSCGRNIFCNIKDKNTLIRHLSKKLRKSPCMSIEEFHPNLRSFRVLVLKEKVIGLVERFSARVIGDGKHTLDELIKIKNKERAEIDEYVPFLPIEINEETHVLLEEKNIDFDYTPWPHEVVELRYVCNTSRGGTSVSLPLDTIHPENARLAVKAVKTIGLKVAGLDFLCEDISVPLSQSKGFVLEANADPDISLHEHAQEGERVQVTKDIMKAFYDEHRSLKYKLFLLRPKVIFGFLTVVVLSYLAFFFTQL